MRTLITLFFALIFYVEVIKSQKALNCDANWYLFIISSDYSSIILEYYNDYPDYIDYGDEYSYISGPHLELNLGENAIQLSGSCNPDFVDWTGANCTLYGEEGFCEETVLERLFYSNLNSDGIWETGENCPECGCGENGAANLNDVLVDEGNKKPSSGQISTRINRQ